MARRSINRLEPCWTYASRRTCRSWNWRPKCPNDSAIPTEAEEELVEGESHHLGGGAWRDHHWVDLLRRPRRVSGQEDPDHHGHESAGAEEGAGETEGRAESGAAQGRSAESGRSQVRSSQG